VQLRLPTSGLERYKSASQRARVATEEWAGRNLYCVTCRSETLVPSAPSTPAIDYLCPRCDAPYQLKSQSHPFASRVLDSAYRTMLHAIETGRAPHLMVLHYERDEWAVANLLFVPRFAFTRSILEKRNPLGPRARRAGWVGCTILLGNIPPRARIYVVRQGVAIMPNDVRKQYDRLRPLAELRLDVRGWTLDVLNLVHSVGRREFSLADVYGLEHKLAALHPANRHVRAKIRQQLQILRDLGLLEFVGDGRYRLL
jgi:type II restriction enzyme